MQKLIAGNWKMNGLAASLKELQDLAALTTGTRHELLICPPATLLRAMSEAAAGTSIATGGQDCHGSISGAHTGDISAEMIMDAGAQYVIVGHSERRTDHGEQSDLVQQKAQAAHRAGLTPIVCVGETKEQREGGEAVTIVLAQIASSLPTTKGTVVVAYEPVWAIGTGLVPTNDDIAEMHEALRKMLGADIRLLYGGSVKPGNAAEILTLENVDGALVGGASLKATDFAGIANAL
ncbi:MAG: triose-phosphate isomerase [Parvularculaceae bacterium]